MKKLPVILALLSTSLMGSSLTNSAEKPTGEVSLGARSWKLSEFRADFEAQRVWKEEAHNRSSSPLSVSSSVPSGQSEFYKEVFKVGTRHQYAATLSEQDEIERALEESRREAQEKDDLATALVESEALALANLKEQEIARLKDQIETLEDLRMYRLETQIKLSASLIQTIDKKNAHGPIDTAESRAAAQIEYDRIDKELNDSRSQNRLIWDELLVLKRRLDELKYGRFLIPGASSQHLPIGIGGPGGPNGFEGGLPPIPSSAIVLQVSSAETDRGELKF